MAWFVYVARCGDGTYYTGVSTDPARRETAHNAGRGATYTRARRPIRVVYLESAPDRGTALQREWAIKRLTRHQKERLVSRGISGRLPSGSDFPGFRPQAIGFLRRLARHNTKAWFERHRSEYESEVLHPLRALVEDVDVRLARMAPELVGDPRRSIFRIHRDIRFSADKSPYKTHAACHFYHQDAGRAVGQDAVGAGAGLYFQLAGGNCLAGGGIWMPARPALDRLREAIADAPEDLEDLVRVPAFRRRFGGLDEDTMLTRLPRGFAAGHPAERWLRYRSFTATRHLPDAEALSPRLASILARDFSVLVPMVRWLNRALGYRPRTRRY